MHRVKIREVILSQIIKCILFCVDAGVDLRVDAGQDRTNESFNAIMSVHPQARRHAPIHMASGQ